jgi:hypothetical protein
MTPHTAPFEKFRATMESFRRGVLDPSRSPVDPVREALWARMADAVQAGLAAIDHDPGRWIPAGSPPPRWGADAFVTAAIEDQLAVHDDREVRWLLATFFLMLTDLDGICRQLEELAAHDLDDVPWLVAGALLVEWSSGQPGTDALRDTLQRLSARRPDLASHLSQALGTASGTTLDLWQIAANVLSDPTVRLPARPITP